MIDIRYKPYWLPQISAPFTYTLDKIKKEGINCKYVEINTDDLSPSQGIVDLDKISNIDPNKVSPIWISNDFKIIDGHHRYAAALSRDLPIKAMLIDLVHKDAIRLMNKIQDIYEYENQEEIMEVVAQDQINGNNDIDSGVSQSEFLATLEAEMDDDREILNDDNINIVTKKRKKITGYRKSKINEKSLVGNFFVLKPMEGYIKYEMEFENLLDTNDMGLIYNKGKSPVFILARTWFPNIDFKKIGKKYDVSADTIINRAVAEKAKSMGYDGIKYGDIMIQGLTK